MKVRFKSNGVCSDHRRQSVAGPGRSYRSCLEGDISESMLPWRLMLHRALEVSGWDFSIFAFIHLYRLKHSALGTTSPIMFNNSIQNNTYSPSNNFPKTPIAIVGNKVTIIRPIHRTILKSIRNVLPDSRWENINVRICEPGNLCRSWNGVVQLWSWGKHSRLQDRHDSRCDNICCPVEVFDHFSQIRLHFFDRVRVDQFANRSRCNH